MRSFVHRRTVVILLLPALLWSCRSPESHRTEADEDAAEIIKEKQKQAFGAEQPFSIDQPADLLRRRLLEAQKLPYVGPDSLGTDALEPIEHWPEPDYPGEAEPLPPWEGPDTLVLSLTEALQVGARNSREYQTAKEVVFIAALDLDLERNAFTNIWGGTADALASADLSEGGESGVAGGAGVDVTRLLKNGAMLAGQIGIDLVQLLTGGGASSMGLFADASITIPLLRGAPRHVVTEPLTQVERNVVYALREFDRYKRTFAVRVASEYLDVLRLLDNLRNSAENYEGLVVLSRRTHAVAGAGRLPSVEVDQARQDELRARNRWISAQQSYEDRLDTFKDTLGLPPDARIELQQEDLQDMIEFVRATFVEAEAAGEGGIQSGEVPAATAEVVLAPFDREPAAPYELPESQALDLAFEHRQDLLVVRGRVYDAQRKVAVAADALRAGLDLFGSLGWGGHRGISTANLENARLDPTKGLYEAGLLLNLPFERTAERIAYRKTYVVLERAVRALQALEDEIKLDVRETLRRMQVTRESVRISVESVRLARDRVTSSNLFLDAGRAQVRDVLEAQEALLAAQVNLTAALVSYRIASLELQRDLGVLQVDGKGIWKEYGIDEQA